MSNSTTGSSKPGNDKLTPRTKIRQIALLEIWNKLKIRQRAELRDLALLYKVSPGLPAQYLYGHLALNEKWMLRFALYLKVAPQDIWTDWEYGQLTHCPSPQLTLINARFPNLSPRVQEEIISLCRP